MFATACGYFTVRSKRLNCDVYVHDDQEQGWELEEFTTSKDAVIEALESFCGEELDYVLTRQRTRPRGDVKFYQCVIRGKWEFEGGIALERSNDTLNEAIILAVLSAHQSPKPKEGE